MNNKKIWQNFNMGIELDIAGNSIYNGLKFFDEMESFYYEDRIFEFLYQIAVGVERLEKITLILLEDKTDKNQNDFEKTLKNHNHAALFDRIKKSKKITLGREHKAFLQILTSFYKNNRYGRYHLEKLDSYNEEKNKLVDFINRYSDENINNNSKIVITKNNIRIKKFIGNVIKKIVLVLYEIIKEKSIELNIYTHEIRLDSKASKIFLREEFDFNSENVLTKELLIFILKSDSSFVRYIKTIKPLVFDENLILNYFKCFSNDTLKLKYMDELENHYEDIKNSKKRLDTLKVMDYDSIDFDGIFKK